MELEFQIDLSPADQACLTHRIKTYRTEKPATQDATRVVVAPNPAAPNPRSFACCFMHGPACVAVFFTTIE